MAQFADLLDEALEAWAYTRAGVIEEVENLSDENMWSALEVAIRYFMTTGLELAIRNAARF